VRASSQTPTTWRTHPSFLSRYHVEDSDVVVRVSLLGLTSCPNSAPDGMPPVGSTINIAWSADRYLSDAKGLRYEGEFIVLLSRTDNQSSDGVRVRTSLISTWRKK